MQSKTLSSKGALVNWTLLRKNLSRFWPLWGGASFLGALAPLAILLQLLHQRPERIDPLDMTAGYYFVLTGVVPVVALLYAVLCAMAVWSYLYNARSAGLMHTLPIRREGLFFTSFLSGMTMMLIPYAVTGGLTILITAPYGGFEPVGILYTVLGVAGISFFYFATATAVAFVTGNLLTLPVLYFLFHFLAVVLDYLLSDLAAGFLFGLTSMPTGVVNALSPTVYLLEKLGVETAAREVTVPGQSWTSSVLTAVSLENFWLVGVYALAGAALLALALLLYRRRRSETAGDVVAVGWMRPLFRYGVALLAALLGGRALYALFWYSFQDSSAYAPLPMAVCMAVAGSIGYYAASMLLAKSLRVFRGSWPGPAAVTAAAVLVCFGMQADLFGIQDRVPEIGQVKTVELYVAGNTYTFYPGEEDALLERVRQLHAAVAADRDNIRTLEQAGDRLTTAEEERTYEYMRLTYRLSGGVTVERQYRLPLSRALLAQPGSYAQLLDALVNSPEMRAKRLQAQDPRYTVDSAWIGTPTGDFDLNSREAQGLLDAVGRDAAAGTWGDYDWFGDDRDAYAVDITVEFRQALEGGGRSRDQIWITLRPGMTETLDYLLDLGALTEGDLLTNEELYPYDYDENWDDAEMQEENVALRAAPAKVPETAALMEAA